MILGANSVLFGGYPLETAFRYLAMAGYDGIELSAIDGMSEHLVLDRWQAAGNGARVRMACRDLGGLRRTDRRRSREAYRAAASACRGRPRATQPMSPGITAPPNWLNCLNRPAW